MPLLKPVEKLQHVQAPKVGVIGVKKLFFSYHTGACRSHHWSKNLGVYQPSGADSLCSDLNEISCKLMWLRNMGQQLPAPEALHPRCYC